VPGAVTGARRRRHPTRSWPAYPTDLLGKPARVAGFPISITGTAVRVRLRLTPRDGSFVDLLAETAARLVDGADLLAELVTVAPGDRPELAARVREAEHHCDDLTHTLLRRLNSTFVTPFDREDIYALASALDDCMDEMEAAADLVVLYRVDEVPAQALQQTQILRRQARCTAEAIPRLSDLQGLETYWIEVNRLENKGDTVYRELLAELFGGDHDALTVLRLKDLTDTLEAACDAFETVANRVQTIALKES
jgi:uncharacterized protein